MDKLSVISTVFLLFCTTISSQNITSVLQEGHSENMNCFATSSKYRLLATGDSKTIKLWDLKTDLLLETIPVFEEFGHSFFNQGESYLTFANKSSWLAFYSNKKLYIYDFVARKTIKKIIFPSPEATENMIWNYAATGEILFSSSDRYLYYTGKSYFIYDSLKDEMLYHTEKEKISAKDNKGFVSNLSISKNESLIAYSETGRPQRTIVKELKSDSIIYSSDKSIVHKFSNNSRWFFTLSKKGAVDVVDLYSKSKKTIDISQNLHEKYIEEGRMMSGGRFKFNDLIPTSEGKLVILFWGNLYIYDLKNQHFNLKLPSKIQHGEFMTEGHDEHILYSDAILNSEQNMVIVSKYFSHTPGFYECIETKYIDLKTVKEVGSFDEILIGDEPMSRFSAGNIYPSDKNLWLLRNKPLIFLNPQNKTRTYKDFEATGLKPISDLFFLDDTKLAVAGQDRLSIWDFNNPTSPLIRMKIPKLRPENVFADTSRVTRNKVNQIFESEKKLFATIDQESDDLFSELDYLGSKAAAKFQFEFDTLNLKSKKKPTSFRKPYKVVSIPDGYLMWVYESGYQNSSKNKLIFVSEDLKKIKEILIYDSEDETSSFDKIHDIAVFGERAYVLTVAGIEIINLKTKKKTQVFSPLPEKMIPYKFLPRSKKKDKEEMIIGTGRITVSKNRVHGHMVVLPKQSYESKRLKMNETLDFGLSFGFNIETNTLEYSVQDDDYVFDIKYIPDLKKTVSAGYGNIKLRDLKGKLNREIETDPELIIKPNNSISLSPNLNLMATGGDKGIINIWDTKNWKKIGSLYIFQNDFMFITPDNYYFASRTNIKGMAFRKDLSSYPQDQFDLLFNRPDIVHARLGFLNDELLDLYHRAYLSRVRNLDLDPKINTDALPVVEIANFNTLNKDFGISTQADEIPLKIVAKSTSSPLSRLFLWVNNVPFFGVQGLAIKGNKNNHIFSVNLKLSIGENNIQTSVIDQNGFESLKESFRIVHEPQIIRKPNLHFVGIGVSEYKNLPKLPYVDNDVRSVAKSFKEREGSLYNQVIIDTLLNQFATKQLIKSIKRRLLTSDVNDIVVFFYSGHGDIDKKNNYYVYTHDIDIKNKADQGLLLEELEDIIDNIPARKKILLINACKSGEKDEDEKAFKIMKNIFPDFKRNNGSMVIASSSGNQASFTGSDSYKPNSAFGFALLDLMSKEKVMTVNNLKNKLELLVSDLTRKKQTPIMRAENLELNFRLW